MIHRTALLASVFLAGLSPAGAAPAFEQLSLEAFRHGVFEAAVVPPPAGAAIDSIGTVYAPKLGAFKAAAGASSSLSLKPLLNRHWSRSSSIGTGSDRQYLCVQFDRGGTPYMGVMGDGWSHPWFFAIQRGMAGRWVHNGRTYRVSLDVSIWRARLNNRIQIVDETAGRRVYDRTITSLLLSTYAAGEAVVLGGRSYQVFHMNDVARTASGFFGADWALFSVVFVYDEVSGGEHDYHIYRFKREALQGAGARVTLFGGQTAGLRVSADASTLDIYD